MSKPTAKQPATKAPPTKAPPTKAPPANAPPPLPPPNAKPAVPSWDPMGLKIPLQEYKYLRRIKKEILDMNTRPKPPGIYTVADEKDLTILHALVVGATGTPYHDGFFYFLLKCPPDYPFSPPRVRLMTTDAGNVRFNPNLYNCGKVCLSILGTWTGPSWSAGQTMISVLLSIQTIMSDKPYHNEPTYEKEHKKGDIERYNNIIHHETMRVAVCGMLDNETRLSIPEHLVDIMNAQFLEHYDGYVARATSMLALDGKPFQDPFGQQRGVFGYRGILGRLKVIRDKVMTKKQAEIWL